MSLASQHGYRSKRPPPYFNTSPTSDFQHSYGRRSRCSDGSWGWQTQILRSNQTSTHRCWGFQRCEGPDTGLWQQSLERWCVHAKEDWEPAPCPSSKSPAPQITPLSLPPVVWSDIGFPLTVPSCDSFPGCILNPRPQVLVLRLCFQENPREDRCSYNF